eukprot:11381135-Alexandrium_andersonii.AAC.1
MPAVLKPSKEPRAHGSRRRTQGSRPYMKPKHVPAADRAARSSHGRRGAADQGGKKASVPPPPAPPPRRRESSHRLVRASPTPSKTGNERNHDSGRGN